MEKILCAFNGLGLGTGQILVILLGLVVIADILFQTLQIGTLIKSVEEDWLEELHQSHKLRQDDKNNDWV